MTHFNFLRAQARWRTVSVPAQLRVPVLCGAAAFAILGGTYAIERANVQDALLVERAYETRLAQSQAKLAAYRRTYLRAAALVRARAKIATIERSGAQAAKTSVEVANALPNHVWLTSVTRSRDVLRLEGTARSFEDVSHLLQMLSAQRGFSAATLTRASRSPRGTTVAYAVTVTVRDASS